MDLELDTTHDRTETKWVPLPDEAVELATYTCSSAGQPILEE